MIGSLFAFHYGVYFYVGKFLAVVSAVGTGKNMVLLFSTSVYLLLDGSADFFQPIHRGNA